MCAVCLLAYRLISQRPPLAAFPTIFGKEDLGGIVTYAQVQTLAV